MKDQIVENLHTIRQDLLRQKAKLDTELSAIEADIQSVDRMISRYEGQSSLNLEPDNGTKPKVVIEKTTFKQLVLTALRQSAPHSMRASQIRSRVLNFGYKSTAKNFTGATFAMLSFLVKQGLVEKTGTGKYRISADKKE